MTVRKFYLGCFELHDYFEIKQYIETCLLFEPGILNIIKTLTHKCTPESNSVTTLNNN